MVLATRLRADAERRPRRMVHTTLSVLASALLVSIPRSDALLALPPAALPPAAIAAAATAAGRGGHHHGRRCVVSATTSSTFVGMTRQRPASWRCAAPGPVCSSSSSSEGRCRRSRSGLLVMSGVGGEEGGEGEGLTEGEELGVVVEGVRRSQLSSSAIEESGSGKQQRPGGAVTTSGSSSTGGESAATTKPKKTKKKKKKSNRGKNTKAAGAPRLEGKALRDELIRREKREEERVLAINTLFYRARAYNEIEDFKRVWDKSELSECIRSVGGMLKGYDNIIQEYKTDFMLAHKQEKPGLRPFKVKNLKVQTCGTLAWVTCIEDMRSPYKTYPRTVQLVTNVFRKTRSGWRLTRHHASDRDVAMTKSASGKQTLKASRELPGGGSSLLHNFVDKTGGVTELSARLFRVVNGEMRPFDLDFDGPDDDDDDDDDDEDEEEEDITDEIGREIASQIFLNYGDLFDGKEGPTEIPLGEINFAKGSSSGGSGDAIDETIPPAMRKRIEEGKMEAKLKSKRGEANQRFETIYNLKNNNGGLKEASEGSSAAGSASEWGDIGTSGKEWASAGRSDGEKGSGEAREEEKEGGAGEAALRQSRDLTRKTVDAVRVLAEMGRIDDKEKGLLLADVIRNASSAGPSMAEVAYSLLLDGDVTPDGMEYTEKADEFAHQCKAITVQLENQQNSNRRSRWKFWTKPQWWKVWARGD
ncbi:unnamed protein product [Pylaiella littoralis]